jgi:ABC-2 type transport system ATP-binding protein
LRTLDQVGVNVISAEVSRPTLDDVFLQLTGRSLRDAGDIVAGPVTSSHSAHTLEAAS